MWQANMPTQSGTEVFFYPGTPNSPQAAAAQAFGFLLLSQCRTSCYVLQTTGLKKRDGRDVFTLLTSMPMEEVSATIARVRQIFPDFIAAAIAAEVPVPTSSSKVITTSTSTLQNSQIQDGGKKNV